MAICGVANPDGTRLGANFCIEAMVSALGKDNGGTRSHHVDPEASLGVTSALETVSLHSQDQLLVACDAEIYNQQELRDRISSLPPQTTTAALIAALYLNHGEAFARELDGVFSIAIWDKQAQKLVLVRDRLGVKPLCYGQIPSGFIFASYPRGILASQLVAKRVDVRAIADYLNFNAVPAPKSAYQGIFKLKPSEYLVWQRGQTRTARYWELRYTEEARGTVSRLAEKLLFRLEEAVRVTSADLDPRRVGCFLSGGTDSSSIAGMFSRMQKQRGCAFSIGFEEERFDELNYARLAAKHFGLTHFERILRPAEAYDLIPKLIDLFDEPFANASAIPTYACAQLAKDHGISVMLAGDGGDELFGGESTLSQPSGI